MQDPVEQLLREVKGAVERSTEASTKAAGAAERASTAANQATTAAKSVTQGLTNLEQKIERNHTEVGGRLQVLERYVFGSTPPPRPGSMPDDAWIAEQAEKSESNAVVPMLARIERKTDEGNSALGVGVRGLAKFYGTREGRILIGAIALALAGLVGGGAMRAPSSPPPAPTVQVVRVEVPIPSASTAPLGSR